MPIEQAAPLPSTSRPIAAGPGWSATEFICTSGPGDRPFEEQHAHMTIAAVLEGTFTYRSANQRTLLYPGALLLGNVGACYECGHDHGRGDRCVALHIDADAFGEIATAVTRSSRFRFSSATMAPEGGLAHWVARLEASTDDGLGRLERDVSFVAFVERVVALASGEPLNSLRHSASGEHRIARALAHIEANLCEPLDLDHLAAIAGLSRFHFVRTFRQVAGKTPYQFVLQARLRRAAVWLATTKRPISTIAFESGFGDLSTFNGHFRRTFGVTPKQYRDRERHWRHGAPH